MHIVDYDTRKDSSPHSTPACLQQKVLWLNLALPPPPPLQRGNTDDFPEVATSRCRIRKPAKWLRALSSPSVNNLQLASREKVTSSALKGLMPLKILKVTTFIKTQHPKSKFNSPASVCTPVLAMWVKESPPAQTWLQKSNDRCSWDNLEPPSDTIQLGRARHWPKTCLTKKWGPGSPSLEPNVALVDETLREAPKYADA